MKLKRTKAPCLLTITVFVFGVAPPSIRGDYFGTLDGYDSEEGRKAICWQVTPNSTFDIPSSDAAAGVRLALLESNANVELMDRCYQGLELNVTLEENPADENRVIYSGSQIVFRFDLVVNTSDLDGMIVVPPNNVSLRIKFCDPGRIGFCTPFSKEIAVAAAQDNVTSPDAAIIIDTDEGYPAQTSSFYFSHELRATKKLLLSLSSSLPFHVPLELQGAYYIIGHALIFLGPNATSGSVELDVANAVSGRIFTIREAPPILEPTRAFKIAMGVVLGIAGLFEVILLTYVVAYRNNMIMKLSQAPFLALQLTCSLMATVSSIFFIPENDVWCNLWSPLVSMPLSMIATIMIARMWRMYTLLASTLRLSLIAAKPRPHEERFMRFLTFLASWQEVFEENTIRRLRTSSAPRRSSLYANQQSLRKEVKDIHVLQLTIVLVIPQVVIQIISLTVYPYTVHMVEEESFFRVTCRSSEWWPTLVAFVIIILLFLMAVCVAWICRDLPTLFNEKTGVFRASLINLVVMIFAGLLIIVTEAEIASPNSRSFVWMTMTLCTALSPCFYIVLPKVIRARKGERVVMSRLFATGPSAYLSETPRHSVSIPTTLRRPAAEGSQTSGSMDNDMEQSCDFSVEAPKIVIHQHEPPPRPIELQLLAMKDTITKFTENSTEGRTISRRQWDKLKESFSVLNDQLGFLEFDWEEDEAVAGNGETE